MRENMMAKPRISKLGCIKTGLYGLVTCVMLSGCATSLPFQSGLHESGPYAVPKEYLPPPIYDYCLSEHDISASLKVMNAEIVDVSNTLFTLAIIAKNNKTKLIPIGAGELSEHISIGYVGHANGFEVVQINELPHSRSVSGAHVVTYEIIAKMPNKSRTPSNYASRYQVALNDWHYRLGSDIQLTCPLEVVHQLS